MQFQPEWPENWPVGRKIGQVNQSSPARPGRRRRGRRRVVVAVGHARCPPAVPPDRPPGGGALVSSIRAQPRSFNRYVARDSVADTICLPHPGQTGPRRSPHPGARALARRVMDRLGRRSHLHAAPAARRPVLRRDAVHVGRRPVRLPGGLRRSRRRRPRRLAQGRRAAARRFRPRRVHHRHHASPPPFGPGLRLLDNLPILPRHRLETALDGRHVSPRPGAPSTPPSEIVGLGPFALERYDIGQRLVFKRNPYYWRKDASGYALPYLDRLTLEIVPDQNAELLRLDAGQIDFTQSEIRPEDYANLKRAADAGRHRPARPRRRRGRRLPLVQPGTRQRSRPTRGGRGSAARSCGAPSRAPSTARRSPTRCSSARPCRCTGR